MQKKYKIMLAIAIVVIFVLIIAGIMITSHNRLDKQADHSVETSKVKDAEKDNEPGDLKDDAENAAGTTETEGTANQEQELDALQAVAIKTTTNVNLRKEPNTDCEIIKVISRGTELQKYTEENGWAKVKCGEDIGYVSAEFLAEPSQVSEEPVQNVTTTTKVEAIPGQHRNPNSAVVVIDPGHQRSGDSTTEPNGPGSSVMKARVSSGTTGVSTGVPEYILNLDISLKLKTELENRGYTVYMTRSTHDVNISNIERAQYASSVGADIAVRIHANGSTSSSVSGAETLAPSANNPYVSHLAAASQSLSRCIVDAYCAATGFKNRGVIASDTMTGINWSKVPVTILELGFMSNAAEDQMMQDGNMQNNMVQGIANGIDAYFGF